MRNFTYAQKDTTLNAVSASFNYGLDEILEVGKIGTNLQPARSLIQFDISNISQSIVAGKILPSAQYFLNLEIAEAYNLNQDQTILVYPVSQSWIEGTGNYLQRTSNPQDGASWNFRSSTKIALPWSGSTFITSVSSSAVISTPAEHLRFNVTSIVSSWISGTLPNYGFVLKVPNSEETDIENIAIVKLFSTQTSTIYKPTLETSWDSQVYVTASLSSSNADSISIGLKNLKDRYSPNTTTTIRISVRDKFPTKTFSNVFSRYIGNQYLPKTSYYSVVDAITNIPIIPFDEFSKISCDEIGSYFILNTSGMYANRPYKILIRVDRQDMSEIFDMATTFTLRQV